MSGSVTISSSGVPARLRSMPDLPWKSSCSDLPASSSRCARVRLIVFSLRFSPCPSWIVTLPADDYRQLELADLITLREIGVEVILARENGLWRDFAIDASRNGWHIQPHPGSVPAERREGRYQPHWPGRWVRHRTPSNCRRESSSSSTVERASRYRLPLPIVSSHFTHYAQFD